MASAESVADHAYRAMLAGRALSVHGALNRLGAVGARLLPHSIIAPVVASLNRRVQGIG